MITGVEYGKYWSAMPLIVAAKTDNNGGVDNGKYRSAMSLILAADSDGNAVVGNGKYRSAMSLIIADYIDLISYVIDYSCTQL